MNDDDNNDPGTDAAGTSYGIVLVVLLLICLVAVITLCVKLSCTP